MMKIIPLRRTMRHLEQRLRMEGETFIIYLLTCGLSLDSQSSDYTSYFCIRLYFLRSSCGVQSQDSQDERFSFGDGDRVFKMRRQGTISRDNRPFIRQDAGFVRPNKHHGLESNGHAWS